MESQDQQLNANSAKQEQVIFTLEDALSAIKKNGIAGITNRIINADCLEVMKGIPDNSVGLVLTSPPYNVGIDYDNHNDNMPHDQYEEYLISRFENCINILSHGGHLIIQVANTGRNPYIHLTGVITYRLRNKIRMVGEIIWNKQNTTNNTAWGSWLSANRPSLRDTHEYILVFRKEGDRSGISDITKEEFIDGTLGIWTLSPETRGIGKHPAPFPEVLTDKIIKLFTFKDEIVLDPFVGSGTTVKSAKKLGRRFIGIDCSQKYCEIAERRLSQEYLF